MSLKNKVIEKILRKIRFLLVNNYTIFSKFFLASVGYKITNLVEHKNLINPIWTSRMGRRQEKTWKRIYKKKKSDRKDLNALKEIFTFEIDATTVLEIGCASGYNQELINKAKSSLNYIGIDKSYELLKLSRNKSDFVNGQAENLPFKSTSIDVILDGATLIHIVDWEKALENYFRVTKNFIILHSITLIEKAENLILTKYAYGQKIYEICFSRDKLEQKIYNNGFRIIKQFSGENYNLEFSIGEKTCSETWLIKND